MRSIYWWFLCPAVFFFLLFDLMLLFSERAALLQIMPNINLTLAHIFRVGGQSHFMLLSSRLNLHQALVSSPGLFIMKLMSWFQISLEPSIPILSPCAPILTQP